MLSTATMILIILSKFVKMYLAYSFTHLLNLDEGNSPEVINEGNSTEVINEDAS